MKKYFVSLLTVLFIVSSPSLFSFKAPLGGEGYHILINNKLVYEHYGTDLNVTTLNLAQYPAEANLTIRYFHCGKLGKNRTLTLKDGRGNIIKEWKFPDTPTVNSGINCTVKEILALQKTHENMTLFYASSELPHGKALAKLL